jgi:hypothetical protein
MTVPAMRSTSWAWCGRRARIAEQVDLPRLLERILELTLQTAGARRGFLIVPGDDDLIIAAGVDAEGAETLPAPVSASRRVARTVVQYAARSGDELVVADAARDPRFRDDPWVREHRVRSLLCLPIRGRDHLLGVLYLENDLTPGVFTPQRLQVLRILGAQAAISMENARLYESLTREVDTRTRELEFATGMAEAEREKADVLLRNILPGAVADELKEAGRVRPCATTTRPSCSPTSSTSPAGPRASGLSAWWTTWTVSSSRSMRSARATISRRSRPLAMHTCAPAGCRCDVARTPSTRAWWPSRCARSSSTSTGMAACRGACGSASIPDR